MENTSALKITTRPVQVEDLTAVVKLHRKEFTDTINSRLGREHLRQLYLAMLRDSNSMVVAAFQDAAVVGVVSATGPEEFKKQFKAGLSLGAKIMLAARILVHPSVFPDLWKEREDRPVFFHGNKIIGCLTAIAVDSEHKRKGIGRILVAAVEEFFRGKGIHSFYLMTRANNSASRKFYERLGLIELEQRGKDIVLLKEIH